MRHQLGTESSDAPRREKTPDCLRRGVEAVDRTDKQV